MRAFVLAVPATCTLPQTLAAFSAHTKLAPRCRDPTGSGSAAFRQSNGQTGGRVGAVRCPRGRTGVHVTPPPAEAAASSQR